MFEFDICEMPMILEIFVVDIWRSVQHVIVKFEFNIWWRKIEPLGKSIFVKFVNMCCAIDIWCSGVKCVAHNAWVSGHDRGDIGCIMGPFLPHTTSNSCIHFCWYESYMLWYKLYDP